MIDARIFLSELDSARNALTNSSAVFKGEYVIHDVIYISKDASKGLDIVFLRLRMVSKNIWNEKSYIVAIKETDVRKVGKVSSIPTKKQFDTEKEAREYITSTYSDQFEYLYEFNRIGWQYDMGKDQVDLEDIEGHFSIEFKSETEEGLQQLLTLFKVTNESVIKGPSVIAIKELLGK